MVLRKITHLCYCQAQLYNHNSFINVNIIRCTVLYSVVLYRNSRRYKAL